MINYIIFFFLYLVYSLAYEEIYKSWLKSSYDSMSTVDDFSDQ